MKSSEWNWTSNDNLSMYARSWEPEGSAKACVILVHGLGEHIGRYEHVGLALTQAGYVLTGYDLRGHGKSGGSKISLGKLMNRIFPAFIQASGLDTKALSHDASVVQAYENDPLVHNKISARLFVEIYQSGLWAFERAREFPLPLLLMHGGKDSLISPEASRQFAATAGDKVALRIWDGLFHEIHNEAEKAQVFAVMIAWLDERLKAK